MNDSIPQTPSEAPAETRPKRNATVRQFLLRGLAISLPPILTIVILIWVARAINDYFINPVSTAVRYTIAKVVDNSRPASDVYSLELAPPLEYAGTRYRVSRELREDLERSSAAK